jgi:hypothetical protein
MKKKSFQNKKENCLKKLNIQESLMIRGGDEAGESLPPIENKNN